MNQLKDELDQKEKYLLQNIQETDLQPFSLFCKAQKGNLNIAHWTYQETIQLADKFKIFKEFDINPNNQINKTKQINNATKNIFDGSSQHIFDHNKVPSQYSAIQLLDLINMPIQLQNKNSSQLLITTIQKTQDSIVVINSQNQNDLLNNSKNQIIGQTQIKLKSLSTDILKPSSLQKKNQKLEESSTTQTIPCRKQSHIMKSTFKKIQIKKHQIVHRTFFLPDYVMYHIQVNPLNKICKRNYQDFYRLKTELTKIYPAVKIPYLQSNSWLSQTNIDFIKKQKCSLQFFLNQLIRHPVFAQSEIVKQFLQIQDHKTMKRKFQDYQKYDLPKCLSQVINFQGNVRISVQNKQRCQIQTLKLLLQKLKQFVSQYYQASYQISQIYNLILTKMAQMTKLVQIMKQTTFILTQNIKFQCRLLQFPKSLNNLQQTLFYQYKNMQLKKQLYTQKYLQFLKYQQQNLREYDSILLIRQNLCVNLTNLVQKQSVSPSTVCNKKNEQLSCYLNMKKTNGILQPSQNMLISNYNLSYINQMVTKQLNWIFQGFGQQLNQKCQQYKQRYSKQHKKLQQSFKVYQIKNLDQVQSSTKLNYD